MFKRINSKENKENRWPWVIFGQDQTTVNSSR